VPVIEQEQTVTVQLDILKVKPTKLEMTDVNTILEIMMELAILVIICVPNVKMLMIVQYVLALTEWIILMIVFVKTDIMITDLMQTVLNAIIDVKHVQNMDLV
jgi:uncharacterized protein (DUF983 family)